MSVLFQEIRRFSAIIVAGLFLASCATYLPGSGDQYSSDGSKKDSKRGTPANSVAVLGVVSRDAAMRDFKRKILANKLETQVRIQQPELAILPYNQLQPALNEQGIHNMLLSRLRMNGKLTSEDWQLIRNSGLKVKYLLVARIEGDRTAKFEPARNLMRNNRGEILSDRREVALMHQRVVEVSATTYDTRTGAVVWTGTFASKPMNKRVYTEYTGSSFTGSVANLLANSFVNGRLSTKYPPAPSASDATDEAFKLIAQKMRGSS